MLRFCSKEVVDCMTDPTCKRALDELQKVGLNDQVGAYRYAWPQHLLTCHG